MVLILNVRYLDPQRKCAKLLSSFFQEFDDEQEDDEGDDDQDMDQGSDDGSDDDSQRDPNERRFGEPKPGMVPDSKFDQIVVNWGSEYQTFKYLSIFVFLSSYLCFF